MKNVKLNPPLLLNSVFYSTWCQRELSSKQYALKAAAKGAYCSLLNSLWHLNAEKGNLKIARIKDRCGNITARFDNLKCLVARVLSRTAVECIMKVTTL